MALVVLVRDKGDIGYQLSASYAAALRVFGKCVPNHRDIKAISRIAHRLRRRERIDLITACGSPPGRERAPCLPLRARSEASAGLRPRKTPARGGGLRSRGCWLRCGPDKRRERCELRAVARRSRATPREREARLVTFSPASTPARKICAPAQSKRMVNKNNTI